LNLTNKKLTIATGLLLIIALPLFMTLLIFLPPHTALIYASISYFATAMIIFIVVNLAVKEETNH